MLCMIILKLWDSAWIYNLVATSCNVEAYQANLLPVWLAVGRRFTTDVAFEHDLLVWYFFLHHIMFLYFGISDSLLQPFTGTHYGSELWSMLSQFRRFLSFVGDLCWKNRPSKFNFPNTFLSSWVTSIWNGYDDCKYVVFHGMSGIVLCYTTHFLLLPSSCPEM